MDTKAHHILIGTFVLLTLLGALLFGLWVAKVSLDDEYEEYDVLFSDPVTGLTKGAVVNFNGIQVGEVRRLRLDLADAARVWARIRVDAQTPVKADTTARLTFTGLTGVVIIELVVGKPNAPPLLPAAGSEVGVILAKPSALQKLMSEGGDVLVRFTQALDRVTKVLSEENTQRVTDTLTHIEAITAQIDGDKAVLGSALRRAETAFDEVGAASTAFKQLVEQGGGTLTRADRLLDKEIGPAAEDLKRTLASLRQVSARVDGLLTRNGKQLDQFAQQGIPGLTATLEDLRALIKSLNHVAERLDAAPADYLLQRDRPREYRRK